MKEYGIIYKIQNKVNGKAYIGQTVDFNKRMWSHFDYKGSHNKSVLRNAIKKYGKDKFEVTKLYTAFSKEELDKAEIEFIFQYQTLGKGYNCKEGGSAGRHTPETCEKLRISSLGNSYNLGKKKSRDICLKFAKAQGCELPILATNLVTGNQTIYLAQFETKEYGFTSSKVSACLRGKAKDGTLLTHKKHTFEYYNYANQNGSVEVKTSSHVQRLGLEAKYENALNKSKRVIATHRDSNDTILFGSAKETIDFGFNLKSVRRVLEGGRAFHKDYSFKYLE